MGSFVRTLTPAQEPEFIRRLCRQIVRIHQDNSGHIADLLADEFRVVILLDDIRIDDAAAHRVAVEVAAALTDHQVTLFDEVATVVAALRRHRVIGVPGDARMNSLATTACAWFYCIVMLDIWAERLPKPLHRRIMGLLDLIGDDRRMTALVLRLVFEAYRRSVPTGFRLFWTRGDLPDTA